MALVQLACAIVRGATNVLQAEQLQYHWRAVFERPVSDSTLRRALAAIDTPVAARVERARAAIRRVVWTLLALRPGGFPWIRVCGRELTGWYVLDLDAAIVTCTSRKEGAAGTFKGSFGHMPLGAGVANTRECVAMLLRPGNAPPNDVDDHKNVLASAFRQLPLPLWSKLLVRIDGAAFSHEVLDHLQSLTTSRRRVRWVTGWASNATDEQAIAHIVPTAIPSIEGPHLLRRLGAAPSGGPDRRVAPAGRGKQVVPAGTGAVGQMAALSA
ncbi:hypothetical protein ACGFZQ_49090 [Streptomyces sp. NPDC048254]|uniref:hypothetical protein n=1 Tax=Streptomyces sp. NPDC048254 TaxID=3365525 RepID=UPI003718D4A2